MSSEWERKLIRDFLRRVKEKGLEHALWWLKRERLDNEERVAWERLTGGK